MNTEPVRRYAELEALLLKVLPEAEAEYHEFVSQWGAEPMLHVLFGEILNTRWKRLFGPPEQDTQLREIFDFVEDMARHPDEAIRNVAAVTICEYLSGWGYLASAWKYMGPSTKPIAHRMAVAWGHPLPEEYEQLNEAQRLKYSERWDEEKEKLGRPITFDDPPRITRRLFAEFEIEPYFPIKDHGED